MLVGSNQVFNFKRSRASRIKDEGRAFDERLLLINPVAQNPARATALGFPWRKLHWGFAQRMRAWAVRVPMNNEASLVA